MTREQVYAQQLKDLGIYEEAFEPEIKTLATLERELTRAKKAWSETAPEGKKPSFSDPHYSVILTLRREILGHRDALGLTPKALRKLRGNAVESGSADRGDLLAQRLEALAERTAAYSGGVEARSESDTGKNG